MKSFTFVIDKQGVMSEVYRLSANAAKERGDVLHVATADNAALIDTFLRQGINVLTGAFGRYLSESRGDSISYTMPDNWSERLGDVVAERCREFLIYFCLAQWFNLSGVANGYMQMADMHLVAVKDVLIKRMKPQR